MAYKFKEKYAELKEKTGVTDYRVSKEIGISNSYVAQWSKGKISPSPEWLRRVADYFEVPMEYFFDKSDHVVKYTASLGMYTEIIQALNRLGILEFYDIDEKRVNVIINGDSTGVYYFDRHTFVN